MIETRTEFGMVRLLDIECKEPADWQVGDATHLRVSLPAVSAHCADMAGRGFVFQDRTLDVSINLMRTKTDFSELVRLAPRITDEHRDAVKKIALESFPTDSRFHFGGEHDAEYASEAISFWVDRLEQYYLCEHKGAVAGFLALRNTAHNCAEVYLAAVAEKYRAAGIAMSLYAHAAAECKKNGLQRLEGRISSANTAVTNLYAFLGASFLNPRDVYIKEHSCKP